MFFIGLIVFVVRGCIWGAISRSVMEGKGYSDASSWFWWGFFFDIIAVIIALTKPDLNVRQEADLVNRNSGIVINQNKEAGDNEWKCRFYNKINANYVGTCGCGKTKQDSKEGYLKRAREMSEWTKQNQQGSKDIKEENSTSQTTTEAYTSDAHTNSVDSEYKKVEIIKKYKELLDANAITQEEFDKKKREILK